MCLVSRLPLLVTQQWRLARQGLFQVALPQAVRDLMAEGFPYVQQGLGFVLINLPGQVKFLLFSNNTEKQLNFPDAAQRTGEKRRCGPPA